MHPWRKDQSGSIICRQWCLVPFGTDLVLYSMHHHKINLYTFECECVWFSVILRQLQLLFLLFRFHFFPVMFKLRATWVSVDISRAYSRKVYDYQLIMSKARRKFVDILALRLRCCDGQLSSLPFLLPILRSQRPASCHCSHWERSDWVTCTNAWANNTIFTLKPVRAFNTQLIIVVSHHDRNKTL